MQMLVTPIHGYSDKTIQGHDHTFAGSHKSQRLRKECLVNLHIRA